MRSFSQSQVLKVTMVAFAALLLLGGCSRAGGSSDEEKIRAFAIDYAKSWSSKNAASVAAHYSPDGSLKINDGPPTVGREAITKVAQGFMTSFPDMVVSMDSVRVQPDGAVFHWTLKGTNNGPGGTGKAVRFSGYEEWMLTKAPLIIRSLGHYDQADFQRQMQNGPVQ